MNTPQRAPIFTATWDFSVWLVKKARAAPNDPLARSLADRALRLLDAITLALKDIDRDEALQSADLLLIQLRLRLRLAMETELLDAQQAHYALLGEIGPVFERRYIEQSFAAGRGRGPHRAALYFLRSQRRHEWRLHLDIHAYFPSVAHRRLLELLGERVRDDDTLALLQSIVASGNQVYRSRLAAQLLGDRRPPPGQGLPLGSWFSQWCGNCFLDGVDHFIKRDLKIPAYLRYMDDLVLFADDKTRLVDARAEVADWLRDQRALQLNPKRLAVEPTWTPAVFVGYRISQAGIAPSRKLRRRLRERLRVAAAKGEESLIRTVRSYRGLLVFP